MTERDLILLGFKSEELKEYDEDETYYYVLDIVDGLTFITPTNEEIKNGEWYVEFFNTDPLVRFHDSNELGVLINTLKNAIVNKK
jgi:hypothetical protein